MRTFRARRQSEVRSWGVALWLVAQTVVMPMMGAGLFSSAMGGVMAAMGSLIGHVLYGSLLGIIASARSRASRTREPHPSGRLWLVP